MKRLIENIPAIRRSRELAGTTGGRQASCEHTSRSA
jgi:hypothetical protein